MIENGRLRGVCKTPDTRDKTADGGGRKGLIGRLLDDIMIFPAKKGFLLVFGRRRDMRPLSNSINSRAVVFGVVVVCALCSAARGAVLQRIGGVRLRVHKRCAGWNDQ